VWKDIFCYPNHGDYYHIVTERTNVYSNLFKQGTISEAMFLCSSMKMSLISIDSVAKLLCLFKLIPAGVNLFIYYNIYKLKLTNPDFKLSTFITSAVNDDDRCDQEGVYSWCSLNKTLLLPALMKSFTKPSVKYQDRCLAFNASSSTDNSSALARTSCTENSLPFICEPSSKSPTCPGATICVKNVKHLMLCLFICYGL